jgi:AcrR family transcriptional regulator
MDVLDQCTDVRASMCAFNPAAAPTIQVVNSHAARYGQRHDEPARLARHHAVPPQQTELAGSPAQDADRWKAAVNHGRGRVASRETWIAAASGMLSEGRTPAEVSIAELEQAAGATRGSLYTYFPKLSDLHRAVIAWWHDEHRQAALDRTVSSVADPAERLRLLRAVIAGNATRDNAMRRWAHTEPAAAAAVAEADGAAAGHIGRALRDLGYSARDANALTPLIATLLPFAEARDFEVMLQILIRAAGTDQRRSTEVDVAHGPDGQMVMYLVAKDLPAEERRHLREEALRFAAAVKDDSEQADTGESTVA